MFNGTASSSEDLPLAPVSADRLPGQCRRRKEKEVGTWYSWCICGSRVNAIFHSDTGTHRETGSRTSWGDGGFSSLDSSLPYSPGPSLFLCLTTEVVCWELIRILWEYSSWSSGAGFPLTAPEWCPLLWECLNYTEEGDQEKPQWGFWRERRRGGGGCRVEKSICLWAKRGLDTQTLWCRGKKIKKLCVRLHKFRIVVVTNSISWL